MKYYFFLFCALLGLSYPTTNQSCTAQKFFTLLIERYNQQKNQAKPFCNTFSIQKGHSSAEFLVQQLKLVAEEDLEGYLFDTKKRLQDAKQATSFFATACTIPSSSNLSDWINPWKKILPEISIGYALLNLRKQLSTMGSK